MGPALRFCFVLSRTRFIQSLCAHSAGPRMVLPKRAEGSRNPQGAPIPDGWRKLFNNFQKKQINFTKTILKDPLALESSKSTSSSNSTSISTSTSNSISNPVSKSTSISIWILYSNSNSNSISSFISSSRSSSCFFVFPYVVGLSA